MRLIGIASVATLVVALAGTNALAQGSQTGKTTTGQSSESTTKSTGAQTGGAQTGSAGGGSQSGSASGSATTPSSGPWTANNVTAAQPFGSINISAAGTTEQSIMAWAQQRTPAERAELSGRCEVIIMAGNASRYPANAQQFCRNYMMVASASPSKGAGAAKTTR